MNPTQTSHDPEQIQVNGASQEITRHETGGVQVTATSTQPSNEGPKEKKSKKATVLRCALCSAIPLGVIGLCAIIFGVGQLILRNILHEIGFTLVGVGGLLIVVALFLCFLAAYLPVKIIRQEENKWKLQVDGDLSLPA